MPTSPDPQDKQTFQDPAPKREYPSTYFVQDRQNIDELTRLTIQGQLVTAAMGGPLAEQSDPSRFRRVLDVGCGPGGWVIDTALAYPTMQLAGIDVSGRMIEYAREQAIAQGVSERVEFLAMDALLMLEFPTSYFDLVNLRCVLGFMRTWDWPKMMSELLRVSRRGAVIRITDGEIIHITNSAAFTQFATMFQAALFRAGNLFEQRSDGVISHFADLLTRYGCKNVQTKAHALEYRAGTPELQAYYEDMQRAFRTLRPFIQKWNGAVQDYDAICQQALSDMQQSDFHATWNLLTAWGTKSE